MRLKEIDFVVYSQRGKKKRHGDKMEAVTFVERKGETVAYTASCQVFSFSLNSCAVVLCSRVRGL